MKRTGLDLGALLPNAGRNRPHPYLLLASTLFLAAGLIGLPGRAEAAAVTYTATTTWIAPAGVTSVTAEVWGGGGGGGGQGNTTSDGGGGGGGGAYSIKSTIAVIPGNSYTVTVGAGGAGGSGGCGTGGGDSWFINIGTVLAKGGSQGCNSTGTPPAGGAGGAAASGVGDTKFSGGDGGRGRNSSTGQGGPGGSSAGTAAIGTSGPDPWTTVTAAAAPAGGGIGGDGGVSNANGNAPASGNGGGGGGSGDRSSGNKSGGNGANGKVTLTYIAGATVASIVLANPNPTVASTVAWTVTFSTSVSGVDASAFGLAATGLSGASITTVTGGGTTWTVSASTGTGAGTLGLNQTGPGSVSPVLTGTFTGPVYTVVSAFAEYRMDEGSWTGIAGEVKDISGNGNDAQAFNSASTDGATPAIAGNPGTCRYGVFDNGGTITQGYVQTPLPNFTSDFTVTAWIRTTNNAVSGQRIFIDDQNNNGGYGISLGDGAAGVLRYFSRGITPVILDSTYTILNNTWYFVAAVADIANKKRTIYVFNSAGALLNSTTEAAWTGGAWGTDAGPVSIGGEVNGPPQSEPPATFHFRGNIDEVRVYQSALSLASVAIIAQKTHACSVAAPVPNHYELSMPTSSVACLPTTVTVTACTDATSPCTNPFAAASGSTAVLSTSGGTLGTSTVTFGATGVASTTLSYPAAPDGTPASVTLSGESLAASNPRQWCPNGTACVVANSGSTTFNTAGFIFSTSTGGSVATIPTQVAGISSAINYYLRAVKTSSTTQACEAALVGTTAINFAYECNNPTTCYTSNLMSVNAGTATTIARNDNGSVASYTPVSMSFDGNGNASFSFNYADAGQVKLWATKAASGTLLSTLTGSSNSFAVKPHHFDITNIACTTVGAGTCAPANGTGNNPAASGPAGAAFIQAGQPFKATVTAMNGAATPAFTPNFGKETAPEGAELHSINHLPGVGAATAISSVLSGFSSGAAAPTNLAWNEVGVLQLHATLSNANGYLGSDAVNGKNSVVSTTDPYVGRFIPDHFDTVLTPQGGGFAYSGNPTGPVPGQPFTVAVTAKNASGLATTNYFNAGGYAKNINLSVPVGGATGQLYVDAVPGGTGAVPASKFASGVGTVNYNDATGTISFVFNAPLPHAPQTIQIHAEDADTGTSSGANGSISVRQGRLRLFNAFGSEKANLSMPLRVEYWSGNSWVLNSADSFTVIPAASLALSGYTGTLSDPTNFGAGHIAGTTLTGGQGSIVLTQPSPAATGSANLAINLGAGAADQSCLAVHPATTGAAIPWLRSINGNCAVTYDRDPSARASFGVYAPETRKTVHMRELY